MEEKIEVKIYCWHCPFNTKYHVFKKAWQTVRPIITLHCLAILIFSLLEYLGIVQGIVVPCTPFTLWQKKFTLSRNRMFICKPLCPEPLLFFGGKLHPCALSHPIPRQGQPTPLCPCNALYEEGWGGGGGIDKPVHPFFSIKISSLIYAYWRWTYI